MDDADGTAWYADPEGAAVQRPPATGAHLVPMYDETIVAYQDLRVVLAHDAARPDLVARAVVIDGRAVGTWKRTLGGGSVLVEVTRFGPLAGDESVALEAAVQRFGRFLGLPAALDLHPLPAVQTSG